MKKYLVFFSFLMAVAMVGYWNTGCGGGDDDGGTTTTVVVTNIVEGEPTVVTNTVEVTPEPPQSLYDETITVAAGDWAETDAVEMPDDGTVIVTVDWSEGGRVKARLFRQGGLEVSHEEGDSPLTLSSSVNDGERWFAEVWNDVAATAAERSIHITIGYEPE